jgi:haloacetate dehalogenase
MEDYRAGLGIDYEHDQKDRYRGRPTLCLWALADDLQELYGDVLAVWRPWTTHLEGKGLPCGHHMAEEAPDLLAAESFAS